MRRRPLLLALVAAAAAFGLAVSLGNWQLRRAQEKVALQSSWDRAAQQPAATVSGAGIADIGSQLPRRVRVVGRFLYQHEVWLQNRQMDGQTGFFLITPIRLADGAVVLVNRGFVQRDPREPMRLPPVTRPAGEVTLDGLAVAEPTRLMQLGENAQIKEGGSAIWQNFDYEAFERASGIQAARWIVQQSGGKDDNGLLRNWPRLSAGVDKHRGYALQWYALAALIAALTVFFGYRALRQRPASTDTT